MVNAAGYKCDTIDDCGADAALVCFENTCTRRSYYLEVLSTPGLVSYWRLGEAANATAADARGLNPGSYAGGPTLGRPGAIPGDPDTAVRFDGVQAPTNQVVLIPDSPSVSLSTYTWELWARFSSLGDTSNGRPLLSKDPGGVATRNVWIGFQPGSDNLEINLTTSTDSYFAVATSDSPSTDTWYHFTFVVQPQGLMAVYVNGTLSNSSSLPEAPGTNTTPITLGAGNRLFGWSGELDEVALYSIALDGDTIARHYSARTWLEP